MPVINHSIFGYPLNQSSPGDVTSVFGRYGNIIAMTGDYTAAMVGAEPTGSVSTAFAAHIGEPDPHTQYQAKSELETIIDNAILEYDNNIGTTPASIPSLRQTTTITTLLLNPDEIEIGLALMSKSYQLRRIEVDKPCRIRLYMTVLDRNNDLSRPHSVTPPQNSGTVIDLEMAASSYYRLDYPIDGYDDEAIPDGYIPYSITNMDSTSGVVNVTLSYLKTE